MWLLQTKINHNQKNIIKFNFFQILQLWVVFLLWDYGFSLQITQDNNLELALCHLVRHTPNYAIFRLDQKGNCLAQVASFKNNIVCLRNNENQVSSFLIYATKCQN